MIIFRSFDKNTHIASCFVLMASLIIIPQLATAKVLASEKEFHTAQEIRKTAKIFLEKMTSAADNPDIDINVNDLDPRLRLRKCATELESFIPKGSRKQGKVTVAVSCSSPIAWKVFITAEIAEYADVIVASRSLSRKTEITEADIAKKRVNIASLRKTPILIKSAVVGSTTKRNIIYDSAIYKDSICMVCRGDSVQIVAKNEFLSINMEAVALSDAGIGDTTLVRNVQSKRTFSAKVVSKDRLVVTL